MVLTADRPAAVVAHRFVGHRFSVLEYFAAAVALILPIAFVTVLDGNSWALRTALLLVVAAVGAPVLLSQTRSAHPLAARAAVAFLIVGVVSSLVSANRTTAIFGPYNQGTGLLFMASLAGAWAIGRQVSPDARPLLERALLVGILANVAITLLAAMFDLTSITPDLVDAGGRSSALAGNPVHLAALVVLGLALAVPRFLTAPAKWALPVAAMAAAVQLSGTRGAVVVMVAIVIWAGHRHGLRLAATLVLLIVLGLAAGNAMGHTTSSGAAARFTEGGWSARPETWLTTTHSLVDHPLLGVGPGQFRTATSRYRTTSIAISGGPDSLFTDAHNLFLEYATTTGLLGLAALVVWLFASVRPARGWLAVGALGILAIHMFEPQSVVTTPLAFLALGASAPLELAWRGRPRPMLKVMSIAVTALAVVAATVFLVGSYEAHQAQLDLTVGPARTADLLLPAWPRTASLLAQAWLFQGITHNDNQADFDRSRSWRVVATKRDPADPGLWNDLAEYDESLGRATDAQAEFTRALQLNPTSLRALDGLARLARARCDMTQANHWQGLATEVGPGPQTTLPPGLPVAHGAAANCAQPASP